MPNNLDFLQELTEDELCELVILPLLEALDFKDIRYLHGTLELGKDIVGKKKDLIDGDIFFGFIVKSKKIDGSVSSNRSLREVFYQIQQTLTSPFINPFNGKDVRINRAYFVTPFPLSQNSIFSLKHELNQYASNVSFIDGIKLLSLIEENLPNLLNSIPNSENRYIRMLVSKFSKNLAISRLGSNREFKLEDIYIPTNLSETNTNDAQFITLAKPEVQEGESFEYIFENKKYLIILADAGAGKSTLMHNAVVNFSAKYRKTKKNTLIPIFVELSKVPFKKIENLSQFKDWIKTYILENFNFDGFDWGKTDRYILLLDGFDEIKSHHKDLLEYLIEIKALFPSGILMTSRPSRIPELGSEFSYFKLNPFTEVDLRRFLSLWFPGNTSKALEVYNFILSDPVLLNFCRTPLILTLFAILSGREKTSELPKRRTDIYEKIIELLIDKWDSIREIKSEINAITKHFILEKLAHATHAKGDKFFHEEEILKTSKKHFTIEADSIPKLLDELIYRSSLIRKVDTSSFSFVHLSFQEFFAAKHMIRFQDEKKINSILFN